MAFELYGNEPTTQAGRYFRSCIWAWRPMLAVINEAVEKHDLQINTSAWSFNDGDGLSNQGDCNALASALEDVIKRKPAVIRMNVPLMGTEAALVKQFGVEGIPEDRRDCPYQMQRGHAVKFVEFLRSCGGFSIH